MATRTKIELSNNKTFQPTGSTLTLSGITSMGNIQLSGNTISSLDTNGNINLTPNGTGIVNINNDLIVGGNVIIQGESILVDSEITTTDAVLLMNSGETGSTVTLGFAGLQIDRGSSDYFWLGFDETRDAFSVGQITGLTAPEIATTQLVATRENTPTVDGVGYWDSTNLRFNTNSAFIFDETFTSLAQGTSNMATGTSSHAEGNCTCAFGTFSHAEGRFSKACGTASHAEGASTYAVGNYSHSEGRATCAIGNNSHSEGYCTHAVGNYSHLSGRGNITYPLWGCGCAVFLHSYNNFSQISGHGANANFSAILGGTNHNIESGNTNAAIIGGDGIKLTGTTYTGATAVSKLALMDVPTSGSSDQVLIRNISTGLVEYVSKASLGGAVTATNGLSVNGSGAVVLGGTLTGNTVISASTFGLTIGIGNTCATGIGSFAQGCNACATGTSSHAEGGNSKAFGNYSHTEGSGTCTYPAASASHAEGFLTCAISNFSHAEGSFTKACASGSHAEGSTTHTYSTASGSHAEGIVTCTIGSYSHSEGCNTKSCGCSSHAEGYLTHTCSGASAAHAEGCATCAIGTYSHSEGKSTKACGTGSHAEGCFTIASGASSHSGGIGVSTKETLAGAVGTFIHSTNTTVQTIGHGANAAYSAILGGINHNIETGNTGATIIGGNTIKLTGTSYIDTTAVSKLAIMDVPTSGSSDQVLIRNTTTGIVEYVSKASLGGGGGGGISTANNGLTSDGTNVRLGGSLTGNTVISASTFGIAFGYNAVATGEASFAQGYNVCAIGIFSHSEGCYTYACGVASHAEGTCTCAVGISSHAEGCYTSSVGLYSHAEGYRTVACGASSHAEGHYSCTFGSAAYSHAEGKCTTASGISSHAEGYNTSSVGLYSHAEGQLTKGFGISSHAEGCRTYSCGNFSHSEGGFTCSIGIFSHSEGCGTRACGDFSHTGGHSTSGNRITTLGLASFNHSYANGGQPVNQGALANFSAILGGTNHNIESGNTNAAIIGGSAIKLTGTTYTGATAVSKLALMDVPTSGSSDQVLIRNISTGLVEYVSKASLGGGGGISTANNGLTSDGTNVRLGGSLTGNTNINPSGFGLGFGSGLITTTGASSFAQGCNVYAFGDNSHAQGCCTKSFGNNSHAEGWGSITCVSNSHAEGCFTIATGVSSHAEGTGTHACGLGSHAEGSATRAIGQQSHSEGASTCSIGIQSHSEGTLTCAFGTNSHAEGCGSIASGCSSHAEGRIACAIGNFSHAEGFNTCSIGCYSHSEGILTVAYGCGSRSSGRGCATGFRSIFACGHASFNHSNNDASQTVGHGANANFSAILGGQNHNIESGNTNAAIIGGSAIKLTGTTYTGATAVSKLAIMDVPTSGSSDQILIRNTSTGLVEYVSKASLGGGGGISAASNGLSSDGTTVSLGGTLTGNTVISASTFGLFFGIGASCATGSSSFAQGCNVCATGDFSMAQGCNTLACGNSSHAEGSKTIAGGTFSHAMGYCTCSMGSQSHSEGWLTCAMGNRSHTEGVSTVACADSSHAEGRNTFAIGEYSHSEGWRTKACGAGSHSGGFGLGGVSKEVTATGCASFNHSFNSTGQTVGHGALAHYSAILGGQDHHIAGTETGATIIGGNSIKLTGSTYIYTTAVGTLAIMSTPETGTSKQVIVRNTTTGKIEYRNGARVQTVTSASSITPNADTDDLVDVTAQAATLNVSGATGTPTEGQSLLIRIRDNGTTRTINWSSDYVVVGSTLPTATTANKLIYVACVYNENLGQWDVIGVKEEV